jgi:hypothetical protein
MYFSVHAEKWLSGSTRIELSPDERGCFIDILARATLVGNDGPGEIRFVNLEQLALEVRNTTELLSRTLEKCQVTKKIRIYEIRKEKIQVLQILNWEKYQHPYLHQRAYRQRQKALREKQKAGTDRDNQKITGDNQTMSGYGDRIRENKKDKRYKDEIDKGEDEDTKLPNDPSKTRFLSLLRELSNNPKTPYPFDAVLDGALYSQARKSYPHVNLPAELEKKFDYWASDAPEYPLVSQRARRQLLDWFKKEEKFQQTEHGLLGTTDASSKPNNANHEKQES